MTGPGAGPASWARWLLPLLLATPAALPSCKCNHRARRPPEPAAPAEPAPTQPRSDPRRAPPEPQDVATPRAPTVPDAETAPEPPVRPVPPRAVPEDPARPSRAAPTGLRLHRGRIDIDVHRMDVRLLLQQIARATNTNVVLFESVKGEVTVQLRNQPVSTAVEVVSRAVGCRPRTTGRMVVIRCP